MSPSPFPGFDASSEPAGAGVGGCGAPGFFEFFGLALVLGAGRFFAREGLAATVGVAAGAEGEAAGAAVGAAAGGGVGVGVGV